MPVPGVSSARDHCTGLQPQTAAFGRDSRGTIAWLPPSNGRSTATAVRLSQLYAELPRPLDEGKKGKRVAKSSSKPALLRFNGSLRESDYLTTIPVGRRFPP